MKFTFTHANPRRSSGFTLAELLVVIGIIGLLAALITNLAGPANDKKRRALVEAEKSSLKTAIDAYHEKMGFYPPDNATNSLAANPLDYFRCTAQSPLFYELTGVEVNMKDPANTVFYGDNTTNSVADFQKYFGRGGVANSTDSRKFLNPPPTDKQRHSYGVSSIADNQVYGLLCSVDLKGESFNYWHYDCSSTNRHNLDSYDLWAVFTTPKGVVTNGNWSQP